MSTEASDGRIGANLWANAVWFVTTNRWEFFLFAGMPIIWGGLWGPLYWSVAVPLSGPDAMVTLFSTKIHIFATLGKVCYALPLVVFYLPIRRSGRPTLKLAWQLALALLATELIISFAYPTLGNAGLYRYPGSNFTHLFFYTVAKGIVLVWFARQAMKISFGHGLLITALSVSFVHPHIWSQTQSLDGTGYVLHFGTGMTLGMITWMCQVLMVVHFDSTTVGGQIRWLAVLLGLFVAGLVHSWIWIDPFEEFQFRFIGQIARENAIFNTLFFGAILGTAYLLGGEPDEAPDDYLAETGDNLAREPE